MWLAYEFSSLLTDSTLSYLYLTSKHKSDCREIYLPFSLQRRCIVGCRVTRVIAQLLHCHHDYTVSLFHEPFTDG